MRLDGIAAASSICAKLQVRDRLSAVQRGRELRLLTARSGREPGGHRIPVMRGHLPAVDDGVMDPAPVPYMIRINGHLGATMLSAFPALAPQHHGAHTVLTGLLDRSALHGVLAEIEALGLELLEIQRLTPDRRSPEPGDSRSSLRPLPSGVSVSLRGGTTPMTSAPVRTNRSGPGPGPVTGDCSRAGSLGTASRLYGIVAHVRSGHSYVDVRL